MLTNLAWREHGEQHKLKAVFIGVRAVWAGPMKLSAWRNLVSLMTKRPRMTVPTKASLPAGAKVTLSK